MLTFPPLLHAHLTTLDMSFRRMNRNDPPPPNSMLETRAREDINFRVGFGAAGSAARGHSADSKTGRFRI